MLLTCSVGGGWALAISPAVPHLPTTREASMPRGKQRTGDTDGQNRNRRPVGRGFKPHRQAEFAGWTNINIPQASREAFEEFAQSIAFTDALGAMANKHMRISLINEYDTDDFVASVFVMDEQSVNAGLMVSQRSSDPMRALAKLAYAIVELLPAEWPTGNNRDDFN